MNPAPSREEALFQAAVAQLRGPERAAFLDRECAGDAALRTRLEVLLAAHDATDGVLDRQSDANRPTITLDLPDLPDPAVGQNIGRYKLLEKLGEGGCGVVYVAEQTEPVRRRVALKVIKLGMDTKQVVARFEAERQALALMDHPNIAKVLDAGTVGEKEEGRSQKDEVDKGGSAGTLHPSSFSLHTSHSGRPYFVMELVRGIPITDYCDQTKLPIKERLDLFIKVCQAIQHAHQKGVIHRDVKPSNILVTLHDGVPVPKVIDFGIAKATQGKLTDATVYTQLHQFIGTPAYMSPEQAEMSGLDIDTRSDIYSLGVLLYELLTGTTPFDAKALLASGIDAMRKTIREKEPVRPSTRLRQSTLAAVTSDGSRFTTHSSPPPNRKSQIDPDLDWIVMKCLEKDRTRRYETANGLAADLKRHLNNEPVVARPPSAAYRFQKAFHRNKVVFAAGATVAVTLVAGLGISTWQWARARRAEEAQLAQANEARAARDVATQAEARAVASLIEARRGAYLADMRLVADSLQTGNIGRARRILAEHRPGPGQEDFREWEWFHFELLARADDSEVIGSHPGGARHLLTSRGDRFVTSGQTLPPFDSTGHIQVWDALRRRVLAGFAAPEGTRTVALSRDGKHLAMARGLEIEIRSLDAPQSVITRLTNWASATSYGQPHRHGLRGGEFGCELNIMHFVGDDTHLVVARRSFGNEPSFPHQLTFIDIRGDAVLPTVGEEPIHDVLSVTLSEDGRLLAADTGDTEVVVLRLPERGVLARLAVRTERLPPDARSPLAFVNEDRGLLTASEGGRIVLWDIATGQRIRTVGEHAPGAIGLTVSPDGRHLVSFGVDHVIRLWDLGNERNPPRVLRGHTDEIWGVGFVAGGQSLVSCGRDQSVRSWDLRESAFGDARWLLPPGNTFATLRFGVLAAVGRELRWTSWDVSDVGRMIEPRPVSPPPSLTGATVIPVLGTAYRLVVPESVEPETGTGLELLLYRGADQPLPVAAFPAIRILSHHGIQQLPGTLLIHGLFQGAPQLLVWDVREERVDRHVPTSTTNTSAMAVSTDLGMVLLGDRAGTIECVNPGTGRSESWPGALPGIVSALVVLPDNRTVVAASRMGVLRKFDWAERRLVLEEVPGSVVSVVAMCLSPGGTRLVTGDAQGTVRLWDVETLREIAVLGRHSAAVGGVRFQPDGRTLLSVDANELRVWRGGSD